VQYSDELRQMNRELKDFLYENMYRHFRVMRMSKRAERFICQIYESYVDEPRQLPDEFQARLDHTSLSRVVVDYIAGMTDRSALLEYRRLYDPLTHP
jgi:dGTPase